ncbi:MAG: hypothetical protein J0I33_07760 [Microbacterium ginsengisoli]|jgi:hypothetical protein|uniref:hypothetical protein n=1 Tax=Microbacterium TaxID=33882 RepID=UPI0006F3C53C|nr:MULTISPECIES: hypothetical protein [unclassified Microbacterium]KQR97693.1 hypothetical protein ASF93_13270 [Microbacterium sp. Leaf347]KQS01717.1 hypothetical protein ASG00_09785 [Microbacterium sp. Leaf351]MBN9198519.1 hypothetical protein [Microbacterium ginsengisoli]OJU78096.1 MAG: hypothetical protein BGO15_02530 [Microbacterium sp. 71-23]
MSDGSLFEKLTALEQAVDDLTPLAVGRGMEHIRGVAADLTPIREGHLVGSASVTVHGDEANLTYPGPYARRQHFELTWKHTHGQALYLEQPMRTEAEAALKIIADTLGEAF